jgi:hypothetical protein
MFKMASRGSCVIAYTINYISKLQMSGEILKNVFLLTYSLILVIKLKLFEYIIISHNFTTKLGSIFS